MVSKSIGNTEILDAIDFIIADKGLSKETIIAVLEESITEIATEKYGEQMTYMAKMLRQTGEIEVYREMHVVDEVKDLNKEILLAEARRLDPNCKVGDIVRQLLPQVGTDRLTANTLRSKILAKLNAIEKQMEYDEFKNREGELVTGIVKRSVKFSSIVAIGNKAEGVLFREHMIPGEILNEKSRVTACIEEVRRSNNDFQIILSRTSNEFLIQLLKETVEEVAEGIVEVKAIARNPGSRAKIAVWMSYNSKVDAVGACIGPRGSRIKRIVEELHGEKIDVIPWDRDLSVFIANAMVPAKASKIEIEQDANSSIITAKVIVPEKDLNLAIGSRGQNVRLASQLTNVNIEIVSEEKRQAEVVEQFQHTTNILKNALDVDDIVAQLLVSEGIMSVKDIAIAELDKLATIEGFDKNIATELQKRAQDNVAAIQSKYNNLAGEIGFDRKIEKLPFLDEVDYLTLIENNIITLRDVADLTSDELIEVLGKHSLFAPKAIRNVMEARKIVYNIDI